MFILHPSLTLALHISPFLSSLSSLDFVLFHRLDFLKHLLFHPHHRIPISLYHLLPSFPHCSLSSLLLLFSLSLSLSLSLFASLFPALSLSFFSSSLIS